MLVAIFVLSSPLISWLLYWYLRVQYYETYLKKIPGPMVLPLVGSGLDMASSKKMIPALMKNYNRFKGAFKTYLGSQPYLVLTEPKDLAFILNSSTILTKSETYTLLHNWLGTGLLTSTGSKWKEHRQIISPAFHVQVLEEFIDVFNEQGDILITRFKEESKKGAFDICPMMISCMPDIISETAMGTRLNAQNHSNSAYVKSVDVLLNIIIRRSFSPILFNKFLYLFIKSYREERNAVKVVQDYTRAVIDNKKKEYFSKSRINEESVDSFGRKKKKALLDSLLEYSLKDPSFTDEHILDQVNTFMFAGHHTTGTSIPFALHALAKHPEIQHKAYEELQSIFSDDPKRSTTYKDLQEMKYLEMVIKETLRVYTTVPVIGRVLEEDAEWNDMTLPKGLMILIFIYGVHHSAVAHKDPEMFDPERFTAENMSGKHPYAYIPFSAKLRNCMGRNFAMLEMKVIVSNILRNFELLPPVPDHEMVLKNEAVLKSDNGVYIQLRSR